MNTRQSILILTACFAMIAGCSRDELTAPKIITPETDAIEAPDDPVQDQAGKATCDYTGKAHKLLAPEVRSIGLTLCRTHFPAGSDAHEAVRLMVGYLDNIEGSGVRFHIAGQADHTDYTATSQEDGVNNIDFVDPDDCTSADCSFGARTWVHSNDDGEIVEFDIGFNDESTWFFGGPQAWDLSDGNTYFRTVLLHELGHGYGFPHVLDATPDLSIMGGKTGKWVGQKHSGLKAYDYGHIYHHYPDGAEPPPDLVLSNYTSEWSEDKENWQCALTRGVVRPRRQPGKRTRVDWTHMNRGGEFSQRFVTKMYLSLDERLDSADVFLRSVRSGAGPFSAFETRLESAVIVIPKDTPPATYYVLLDVDGEGLVDEFNENNNIMAIHNTLVVIPSAPSVPGLDIAVERTREGD